MRKRIVCLLLSLVLAASTLSGCNLIEYDRTADMAQTVATVTFNDPDGATVKELKKYELLRVWNSQSKSLMDKENGQGLSVEDAMNYCVEYLFNTELLMYETQRLVKEGKVKEPSQKQVNDLWKSIYSSIDNELYSLATAIAKERGQGEPAQKGSGAAPSPQYPLKAVKAKDDEEDPIEDKWVPDQSMFPAERDGEFFKISVEALKRFSILLVGAVTEEFLSEAEKAEFKKDKEALDKYKAFKPGDEPEKCRELYWYFQDSWCIKYIFYDSSYKNLLFTNLQKHVVEGIEITDEKVEEDFNGVLSSQFNSFTQNIGSYTSALDGDTLVLYNLDVGQFYVKHILVQFSDEQKQALDAYKADQKHTQQQIDAYRDRLAMQITSYEHRDGYDYVAGGKIGIQQIYGEIRAKMAGTEGNSYLAETKFEDLIFKYNADPGIFNNGKGYGLRYGGQSSYVAEFTKAANELFQDYKGYTIRKEDRLYTDGTGDKTGKLGTLSGMVITDFGIHFLMLSSVVSQGRVYLSDYTNVMMNETYREIIKEQIKAREQNQAYERFTSNLMPDIKEGIQGYTVEITKFESRYADVIRDAS